MSAQPIGHFAKFSSRLLQHIQDLVGC